MSQYYKKYMKKREEEKPSYAKLFIAAFLLMMVFFVILATHLTSSVDTSIGENDEGDMKESGLGVKHLIDSRLRFIQMEDASGPATKKEETATIQQYDKNIEEKQDNNYSGKYQNSYGYEATQETKPYSQTYANAQKQYNTYSAGTTGNSSSNNSSYASRTYTVPTPQTQVRTPSTTPKPAVPTHNIQKNLTPTGMN